MTQTYAIPDAATTDQLLDELCTRLREDPDVRAALGHFGFHRRLDITVFVDRGAVPRKPAQVRVS